MFDFVKQNYLSTSSYFGIQNCIDGVMVSSAQVRQIVGIKQMTEIGICCFSDQHAALRSKSATGRHVAPLGHYFFPDSGLTSLCSYFLTLSAYRRSSQYQRKFELETSTLAITLLIRLKLHCKNTVEIKLLLFEDLIEQS